MDKQKQVCRQNYGVLPSAVAGNLSYSGLLIAFPVQSIGRDGVACFQVPEMLRVPLEELILQVGITILDARNSLVP